MTRLDARTVVRLVDVFVTLLVALSGVALVVYGLWLVYAPLAYIAVGVALVYVSGLWAQSGKTRRKGEPR